MSERLRAEWNLSDVSPGIILTIGKRCVIHPAAYRGQGYSHTFMIKIDNQQATITGVYPNFFQIEAQGKSYTHKYVDILMKNVRINEISTDFDKYNISSDGHTLGRHTRKSRG